MFKQESESEEEDEEALATKSKYDLMLTDEKVSLVFVNQLGLKSFDNIIIAGVQWRAYAFFNYGGEKWNATINGNSVVNIFL